MIPIAAAVFLLFISVLLSDLDFYIALCTMTNGVTLFLIIIYVIIVRFISYNCEFYIYARLADE